jgi:hypothetical protein
MLLVVISWVSFWLNREATNDRISLGQFRASSKSQVGNRSLPTVLYGIISTRRCGLPCNCSREKNQLPRELALIAISLLAWWLNEIHMVEAENELPYCLS